jgi:F0F1-type ATP synthase membrane subunit b/b'
MTPELLAAILNAASKFGFDAVIAFLENRGSTIDDTIEALKKAKEKSLEDYIAEDAAARLKASQPPNPLP